MQQNAQPGRFENICRISAGYIGANVGLFTAAKIASTGNGLGVVAHFKVAAAALTGMLTSAGWGSVLAFLAASAPWLAGGALVVGMGLIAFGKNRELMNMGSVLTVLSIVSLGTGGITIPILCPMIGLLGGRYGGRYIDRRLTANP